MKSALLATAALIVASGAAFAASEPKKTLSAPVPSASDLQQPATPVPSFRDMMLVKPWEANQKAPPGDAETADDEGPGDPNADVAYGAYQRGLYRAAFDEAKKRAEATPPSAAAMTLLGQLYADGAGVARDPKQAARWYERAAAKGDREAMLQLGLLKLQGAEGARDLAGASKLFEKAGALGEPEALYNLAVIELQGQGRPQDFAAAAKHMKAAAELGEAQAQYAYAVLLKEGQGVERDPAAAADWLKRAAAQDDIPAMVEYGIALFNGAGVDKDEAAAAQLFRRAAERGNAIAQNRLARLYAHGRGLDRDPARAAAWHQLARRQGLGDAWLDGFVASLPAADRDAADKLAAKWSEGFGPIAQGATAEADAPKP